MTKTETFDVYLDDEKYIVIINYRKRRSMSLRLNMEKKTFYCNVPLRTTSSQVRNFLDKYMLRLKNKAEKYQKPSPINGDSVYIFGEKKEIEGFSLLDEKKKDKHLKDILLEFIIENAPKNAEIMGITTPYALKVRKMRSRWGVNNKKSVSLTFSTYLVHYSKEIIESVVIHELAHDSNPKHDKKFYDVVYRYCPNYKELHKKLSKGIYE